MGVLHNIYFSARGTTKICAEYIGLRLNGEMRTYDWLREPCSGTITIPEEDVLLLCMPVYGGFIPQNCAEMAGRLRGSRTPAVVVAVYGNRHYDNALLQMKDILKAGGFEVVAAGAFLAEHSVFPRVAAGRPDEKDKGAMEEFASSCRRLLDGRGSGTYGELRVPGTPGYDARSYKGIPLKPDGDRTCIGCGKCAAVCPCGAVSRDTPRRTDAKRCISCGACIAACPVGARDYHGLMYQAAETQFRKKCASYRLPETYYAAEE